MNSKTPSPSRSILIKVLRSFLLFYAMMILIGLFGSTYLLFPYNGCSYAKDLSGLDILESSDGTKIATRFWPTNMPDDSFLILYFHGNGEDLGHLDSRMAPLIERGFCVLAMDYRGYGLSEGTPTENTCYSDALLFYDTALERGFPPEKIVIWGRSVGSGPAVELALQKNARTLILESPFSSAFRVMTKIPLLPFDRFNNLSKISQINEPLFVIHGDNDSVIPSWHSEALFKAHTGPKERQLIPQAGHNDLWTNNMKSVLDHLIRFVNLNPPL